MRVQIAVIYYSVTGTVRALAQALAEGAAATGADVRLRRVAEVTPGAAGDAAAPGVSADAAAPVPVAAIEDLEWANALAFGTPSRFGAPAAQLKYFIDQTAGLWREGRLADKPVTSFTSAFNQHGGNEATILSLSNVFYHWGALIVPPGYTDAAVYAAGGNPYGTSAYGPASAAGPDPAALAAARYQGRRLAGLTSRLLGLPECGSPASTSEGDGTRGMGASTVPQPA